ncbi:MAG: hypothetical protein QMC77_08250 [Methanocellales archaeon]|nr:hypothetical protein [Methanocellales archaeon]
MKMQIIAIILLISVVLATGCIRTPREEAISIAMQVPEFKQASEQGDIVFHEENGTWIVKVAQKVGNESVENPIVFIDSETKEIVKVYKISEIEAKQIALNEWWKDKVMIPENRAVAIVEDRGDHWLVTIQIVDMFTGKIISENAGEYRIDKMTGKAVELSSGF